MNLVTGNLLWPAVGKPLVTPTPLANDLTCDALVLGAGITGAFTACLLAAADLDVVVIDRRGVAEGSTPASTALVQYEIDTPLIELAADVGLESAQAAYRACRRALDDIVELTATHHIDCDLHWCGSLFLATEEKDAEWFIREAAARQALGIEVEPLSRRELQDRFDINRPCALHSRAAMEIDPFKLTHGLLRAAENFGARVYEAKIDTNELKQEKRHLTTADGHAIAADHLVIATGYETPEQFARVAKYCTLKSTYALASKPLEGTTAWPGKVMLWESGDPYFYARHTVDNRVIIGGEDEPFSNPEARDALIDAKIKAMLEKFRILRPDVAIEPEYCWAGTFGESADGMPLIGQLPDYPGCHFALGYGGNGLTFAVLAAQMIRDAIVGRENPLSKVFRFDR